jgi:hypothetical protein
MRGSWRLLGVVVSVFLACCGPGPGEEEADQVMVGPSGGSLTGPRGAKLAIPAGALAEEVAITIEEAPQPAADGQPNFVGRVYEILPSGTELLGERRLLQGRALRQRGLRAVQPKRRRLRRAPRLLRS